MNTIPVSLAEQLLAQEEIVTKNLDGFVNTVAALGVIRDQGLYQAAGYSDFKTYCSNRWNMSYSTFLRQTTAAEVAGKLPDGATQLSQSALLELAQSDDPAAVYEELASNQTEITGLSVRAALRLQDLSKRSVVLAQKVRDGELSVDLAVAVQDEIEQCKNLPNNGSALARAILQYGIYNVEVIKTLRSLEYWGHGHELSDIVASGMVYLNDVGVPVNEVTADDIRRLRGRLTSEAKKAEVSEDTYIAAAENRIPPVYGDVAMVQIACDTYAQAHAVLEDLEAAGYEIFTVVATKGQPVLRGLDGRPTTRTAMNGSTPEFLRRNAEGMVYK